MTNKKFALLFLRLLTFACGPFRTWDSELTPGGPLNPGTSGCWSSPLSADDRSIPNPEFHHHRPLPPLRPPSRQWRPARPRAERATSYGGVVSSPMACLAPQFRWAPSPSAHAQHHPSVPSSSSRCASLRVRCAVTSTAVVDAGRANGCCEETLRLPYAARDSSSALQVATFARFSVLPSVFGAGVQTSVRIWRPGLILRLNGYV
jgi:hypothetical protein